MSVSQMISVSYFAVIPVTLIPYNFALVPTNVAYNSLLCELICEGLAVRYPFIGLQTVGKSKYGRPLVVLKLGHGKRELFFNAAHHANEWITTPMVLRFTEQYADAVVDAVKIGSAFADYLFDTVTLYVMPMVDPDGGRFGNRCAAEG